MVSGCEVGKIRAGKVVVEVREISMLFVEVYEIWDYL